MEDDVIRAMGDDDTVFELGQEVGRAIIGGKEVTETTIDWGVRALLNAPDIETIDRLIQVYLDGAYTAGDPDSLDPELDPTSISAAAMGCLTANLVLMTQGWRQLARRVHEREQTPTIWIQSRAKA